MLQDIITFLHSKLGLTSEFPSSHGENEDRLVRAAFRCYQLILWFDVLLITKILQQRHWGFLHWFRGFSLLT